MTLYVSHLTLESSLHVLSQMLFGGPDSPMLFLVGLAVLKIKQQFVTDHDDVNPVDMCHDIPCDELCKVRKLFFESPPPPSFLLLLVSRTVSCFY